MATATIPAARVRALLDSYRRTAKLGVRFVATDAVIQELELLLTGTGE